MIICKHFCRAATFAISVLLLTSCDSGSPSQSADELAADSALAADLALANRDTLLVDSIGAYRPPNDADTLADSALTAPVITANTRDADRVAAEGGAPAPSTARTTTTSTPSPTPTPAPVEKPAARSAPSAAKPASTAPTPRLTGARACTSPSLENQTTCLKAQLAAADSRLNGVYRALITEMRRQENVAPGAKDPPSVQRLRVAQRAWLVYRDTECRRRGRGTEGPLWARPRAKCLGQFAGRRANELADNFSRLTAH
jgi:uncharacterized protein YecT (DUF1311 family)